jgi:hypothetical protein
MAVIHQSIPSISKAKEEGTNHLTLDKYHFFKKESCMLLYAWRSQNTQGKEVKALQRSESPSDAERSLQFYLCFI